MSLIFHLLPLIYLIFTTYQCGSVFGIRIWILKGPEYGSNVDPDPQRWLKYAIPVGTC